MSALVVDASVAGGWLIGDEVSPYADAVLTAVTLNGALVPSLWPYEIANMLAMAERRDRATAADVSEALRLLSALPVEMDPPRTMATLPAQTRLAREYGLSAYDASYLELAIRRRCELATRDAALGQAAKRAGVALFAL